MPSKPKVKASARLRTAKKARGAIVNKRVKQISASKSASKRGRALNREDLEALRDGRA